MGKKALPWNKLDEKDWKILRDFYHEGPDCAKFVSRRFGWELKETMERLKRLENLGFLKRIEGRFATIRGKFKHMNHTYYDIVREVKLFFRRA
jgi:DNA-binding Lrp family transcriptional regulator